VVAQAETPASSGDTSESTDVRDQLNRYSREGGHGDAMSQVTSVSQLSDVQPTDWAFQALQSLVERYGCIAGYPDGTYRGNRAMTRYEFAAGLNACLNRVNELIATATADLVRKEDLATLQRLQEEFATELAALRGRVDALEARTAQLEANQFSTTTKLVGEAIFAVTDEFNNRVNTNTVFQDRVRLDLQTSFTGKDTLHTRLTAGNANRLSFQNSIANGGPTPFGTYEGTQSFNLSPNYNNGVGIDWLSYYFPLFDKAQVYIAAAGGIHSDYAPTTNPYFEGYDGGNGSLSVFADENPIYRIGGGAGGAINLGFGKGGVLGLSSITLGYLADNANNPGPSSGLFNGDYAALGQVNFNLGDRFAIGGTYVHGYHTTGSGIFNLGSPGSLKTPLQGVVGTAQANDPSILTTQGPTVTNSYGVELAFRLTDHISISGFGETTFARILGRGDANIWSYGGGIAFPDLGKQGNVLGLFAGVEPTLRGLTPGARPAGGFARDNGVHLEAFYKYQLSDNISITPGVIYLIDPGQNSNNQWRELKRGANGLSQGGFV
jgi:BMFP domain-containing protein YqiC